MHCDINICKQVLCWLLSEPRSEYLPFCDDENSVSKLGALTVWKINSNISLPGHMHFGVGCINSPCIFDMLDEKRPYLRAQGLIMQTGKPLDNISSHFWVAMSVFIAWIKPSTTGLRRNNLIKLKARDKRIK